MPEYEEELKKFRKGIWDLIKKTLKENEALDVSELVEVLLEMHLDFTSVQQVE